VVKTGGVLGLFTEHGLHGGIQASGHVAWQGIAREFPTESYYFCYSPSSDLPTSADQRGQHFTARHRQDAIWQALRRNWPVKTVFAWHLRLVKLLPFFRLPQAEVILFLHGIEAWQKLSLLDRLALKRVNLFLSNSEFTWRRFLHFNPEFQHYSQHTVPLGIGEARNDVVIATSDTPIALMISRMSKAEDYKGHREIIRAWPGVLARIPEAELWIVGEGDLRPELELFAQQYRVTEKVHFWGWVSEERKQAMIEQCRCLALPSRAEGFGLVYLEAMRSGRPCLVSTFDAAREVVNPPEAGLAVDPTDGDALLDALCQLLSLNESWRKRSEQARLLYNTRFTAAHFQQRLAQVRLSSPCLK
jgi:glycosyltransferase involved in cell wall biosynthesis